MTAETETATVDETTSPESKKSPEPEAKGSEKGAETSEVKAQGKQQPTESKGETKPEGDGDGLLTGDGKGEEPKPAAEPEGAPEAYDFTTPEGEQWSSDVMDAYGTIARELDLTQDKAQKLLDTMGPTLAKALDEAVQAQNQRYWDEWKEQARKDKVIGGKEFKANIETARTALTTFGDDELAELLHKTGLTNNPAILRWAYRVGRGMSEDGILNGEESSPPKIDRNDRRQVADRMFPSMREKK